MSPIAVNSILDVLPDANRRKHSGAVTRAQFYSSLIDPENAPAAYKDLIQAWDQQQKHKDDARIVARPRNVLLLDPDDDMREIAAIFTVAKGENVHDDSDVDQPDSHEEDETLFVPTDTSTGRDQSRPAPSDLHFDRAQLLENISFQHAQDAEFMRLNKDLHDAATNNDRAVFAKIATELVTFTIGE